MPSQYNSTTFLGNGEYYTSLPLRPVSSGVVPNPDPFVECLTSSVRVCAREFTGPGFRACLYGMFTASNLLPTGVSRGSDVNQSGGFATGLQLYCPFNSISNW